jgi:hypothetical protein
MWTDISLPGNEAVNFCRIEIDALTALMAVLSSEDGGKPKQAYRGRANSKWSANERRYRCGATYNNDGGMFDRSHEMNAAVMNGHLLLNELKHAMKVINMIPIIGHSEDTEHHNGQLTHFIAPLRNARRESVVKERNEIANGEAVRECLPCSPFLLRDA